MILDNAVISPKTAATRSKLKTPTSPQFKPPTITRTSATQSSVLSFLIRMGIWVMLYAFRPITHDMDKVYHKKSGGGKLRGEIKIDILRVWICMN